MPLRAQLRSLYLEKRLEIGNKEVSHRQRGQEDSLPYEPGVRFSYVVFALTYAQRMLRGFDSK